VRGGLCFLFFEAGGCCECDYMCECILGMELGLGFGVWGSGGAGDDGWARYVMWSVCLCSMG